MDEYNKRLTLYKKSNREPLSPQTIKNYVNHIYQYISVKKIIMPLSHLHGLGAIVRVNGYIFMGQVTCGDHVFIFTLMQVYGK